MSTAVIHHSGSSHSGSGREVLGKLDFRLPFYFRYVDNILTAVPKTAIDSIVDKFNEHHPRLQFPVYKFTLEIGGDRINFLDRTIIKNNNKLIFDWYHKPTYLGRYLSFLSVRRETRLLGWSMECLCYRILLFIKKIWN